MTTYFRRDVNCTNCKQSSSQQVLGSTNAFGSPDLDLRPPEMKRFTMWVWLQLCPHCSYVAPELSEPVGNLSVIAGSEYQQTLRDERYPELARWFLAYSLLTVSEDPTAAAFSRLHAAWVCDDSRQPEQARECRQLAAGCFAKTMPVEDSESGITTGAVFVDVLRRAGEFNQAVTVCDSLLAYPQAVDILRKVLDYQRQLALGRDDTAHRVEQAIR